MNFIRSLFGVAAAMFFIACAQAQSPQSPDAALITAAEAGDIARVQALIAQGASVKARDARGRTALLAATHANRVDAARLLIAAGADVNAKDDLQDSAFLYAGAEGRLEILRLTLAAGADLKSTNRYGGTALIPACHHGHAETVRELLKTRIDIDHVNRLGWTALLEAVILGDGSPTYVQIVRLLVEHRANVNIADREGVSPLAHAKRRGFREIAQILERAGARRNPVAGFQPLFLPLDSAAGSDTDGTSDARISTAISVRSSQALPEDFHGPAGQL